MGYLLPFRCGKVKLSQKGSRDACNYIVLVPTHQSLTKNTHIYLYQLVDQLSEREKTTIKKMKTDTKT